MSDNLTKEQRSYCMSRIRSRDTKAELKYKKGAKGFIYQPDVFGKPDFINYKKKIVVFIDGCFWHKCPKHFVPPKSKIERNITRDGEIMLAYKNHGWKVIRIWEHELK